MSDHVVIVGGGFSGTLAAINLVRHAGPCATLIERRADPGTGIAYGAAHPSHLLNVRAGNMSAYPDEADHLVRWLAARGRADLAFVPRLTYGAYLRDQLAETMRVAGDRLTIVQGEAVDIAPGARAILADGRAIAGDAVILAPGNLPPHAPAALIGDPAPPAYFGDPWAGDIAAGLGADDLCIVIGTGLTMIDVVLKLEAEGFAGRILAVSRRGLLPHAHAAAGPPRLLAERPPVEASRLLRAVRVNARAAGWRPAVDALRPFTQMMWGAASPEARRRFLRHLRPWWDVHRHRIAPEVADRIAALRAAGRLEVIAAKPIALREQAGGVSLTMRRRGQDTIAEIRAARAINCTGPQGDLARSDQPLLRNLVARGLIRPDALHLGIDVSAQGETIGADGRANPWLYAIGPMTRGSLWEIVAVPDIRQQAWTLARRLAHAEWVQGEGL